MASLNVDAGIRCGFRAPNLAKLKAVVNVLQRTYFKTLSHLNLIIFVTARQFHLFLTLSSQLRFTKIDIINSNLREDFKGVKCF